MGRAFSFLFALASLAGAAHAESLTLKMGNATLITLSAEPAQVIVGDTAIASVETKGNQLIIRARRPGSTNLYVLNKEGANLASLDIVALPSDSPNRIVVSSDSGETDAWVVAAVQQPEAEAEAAPADAKPPEAEEAQATDKGGGRKEESEDGSETKRVKFAVGSAGVIRLPAPASRIVVGSDKIFRVTPVTTASVELFALKAGKTSLFFFDSAGEQILALDIEAVAIK